MSLNCVLKPKVRTQEGKLVESRLFKDLLQAMPTRNEAVDVYSKVRTQAFKEQASSLIQYDEYQEPTIESLIEHTDIMKSIDTKILKERLNKSIKSTVKYPITQDNYDILQEKALQFNLNTPFRNQYQVVIKRVTNNNTQSYQLEVVESTPNIRKINKKLAYNKSLNEKLIEILNKHGVSVGTLTALEERLGIAGVTDFDKAKTVADGMIELIRIANGQKGLMALPEEFSHFAIEALGDNVLLFRFINLLSTNEQLVKDILGEEYDVYSEKYGIDKAMLAKEAAAKLLAEHLIRQHEIKNVPYKSLLQRVINAIKNFFKNFSISDVQRAKLDADSTASELAKQLLDGILDADIKVSNISTSNKYYQLTNQVSRDKQVLDKLLEIEKKRLSIYIARTKDPDKLKKFKEHQESIISELSQYALLNDVEGIYNYIQSSLNTLKQLEDKLDNMDATNIKNSSRILRDIRNYIYSYKQVVSIVRQGFLDAVEDKELNGIQSVWVDKGNSIINEMSGLIEHIEEKYKKKSTSVFAKFIEPFIGKGIKVPFGKLANKEQEDISVEELIRTADQDISFMDRWLNSMADCSDVILKSLDQIVKNAKGNARMRMLEIDKQLKAAAIRLEQAGIKDFDWMFETYSDGTLNGRYISKLDYAKYEEARKAAFAEIRSKYSNIKDRRERRLKEQEWISNNATIVEGVEVPLESKYTSTRFKSMNKVQKEFYDYIIELKKTMEEELPPSRRDLYRAVMIRKDLVERVRSSQSLQQGAKHIWERIKDDFVTRGDDTMFGNSASLTDFEDRNVQLLPIYFTNLGKGESMNDLSTDVVSTMLAYSSMAVDFGEMSNIVNILENGRDILRSRRFKKPSSRDTVQKYLGDTVANVVYEREGSSRFLGRLDDFFEMQVYNRYMKDETLGKVNLGKAVNFLNKLTALCTYAGNALGGIANVNTGNVMMYIEAAAGKFFKVRDVAKADAIYAKELPSLLGEVGSRVKTSKLNLWNELFDIDQQYSQQFSGQVDWYMKSKLRRLIKTNSLYFLNNAGEHWMATRTSLALAEQYKMKSPSGEEVSLWDAMEVFYLNSKNHSEGARLQVKKGYKKLDGSDFTSKDIQEFIKRCSSINQHMHGIYNHLDMSAVQHLALGRLAIMFRKWIVPSINKRFSSAQYNMDTQEWQEGYYRSLWRFVQQNIKDIKEGTLQFTTRYDELHPIEKQNLTRALTEVGTYGALAIVLAILDALKGDDDDKELPYIVTLLEYQARRLKTELGALVPGPSMIFEGFKIIKSPAAAVSTATDILQLYNLLLPSNYEWYGGEDAVLQSGRFKGHSRAYKYAMEVMPLYNTIDKAMHPEELIEYYERVVL